MLLIAATVAAVQASQARLSPPYVGLRSRMLIAALCYLQPLIRSWKRYHTRLFSRRLVERGTHDELLRFGGLYKQLHDFQQADRRRRLPRDIFPLADAAEMPA